MHHIWPLVLALAMTTGLCQPSDWVPRIARGDMVWTDDLPSPLGGITPGYYPVVGNGYLAKEPGPFLMPFVNAWPWRDAGSLHVAGVNNGQGFIGPSHRAQIPPFGDPIVLAERGASYTHIGSAIDYREAAYLNRTVIESPGRCENTLLEQRQYVHRARPHVLVYDFTVTPFNATRPWSGCVLTMVWEGAAPGVTPDVNLTVVSDQAVAVWSGPTHVAEETSLNLTVVGVAVDLWVTRLTTPSDVSWREPGEVKTARVVVFSDVAGDAADPPTAALAEWTSLSGVGPDELFATHVAAWGSVWSSGVEVSGNTSFASLVNASLYDIVSSMRSDWVWSTSPGGLGTNGYCGHTFWDMETWMFPVLLVLFPDLARNAVDYRIQRLGASIQRASDNGYLGAFWVWESAITGLDTAPCRGCDLFEIHISADIPLAWRRYYYATGDEAWLATAWPAIEQTCIFWECRFTRKDSVTRGPGMCSGKDGVGNFTVRDVICPDESSGVVNDSVYTNAAGAQTLQWCVDAAAILGKSVPPLWQEIASAPYMPFNTTEAGTGAVHQNYAGYTGKTINQADVALLQYPLGLKFEPAQAKRDLDFWSTKTDFGGMFTGDAAYSAAYLALGERDKADEQLALAWTHLEPHFNVFMETSDGRGTQHFITGNGGFLQNVVFGYPGLRIERLGVLAFSAAMPVVPLGATAIRLRGLHVLGHAFDFSYNATALCVVGQAAAPAPLRLMVVGTGATYAVPPSGSTPFCVAVQAVEIIAK